MTLVEKACMLLKSASAVSGEVWKLNLRISQNKLIFYRFLTSITTTVLNFTVLINNFKLKSS